MRLYNFKPRRGIRIRASLRRLGLSGADLRPALLSGPLLRPRREARQNPRSNAAPPRAQEVSMQLIGMLDSPYVRRVVIALIVAKAPFKHRPISLFRHIDEFSKNQPASKGADVRRR